MAAKTKKPQAGKLSGEKPATKRKPHDTTSNETKLATLALRDKILDGAALGMTVRQIAAKLTADGEKGCSRSSVHKHLSEGLEDIRKNLRLKHSHLIELELQKLQKVEAAHLQKLVNAREPDDINKLTQAISRIWQRRDAILGLHKPIKLDMKPNELLAKLLGRSPEEFPSGDVES